MKKLIISKNNIIVQTAIFETEQTLNEFIEMLAATSAWGKPEQTIQHPAIEAIEGIPAHDIIPAVFNAEGIEISPMIPAFAGIPTIAAQEAHVEVIPAEYSIEITDCTAEIATQKEKAEASAYLNATDFKIIKSIELGTAVAGDILIARAAARAKLQ